MTHYALTHEHQLNNLPSEKTGYNKEKLYHEDDRPRDRRSDSVAKRESPAAKFQGCAMYESKKEYQARVRSESTKLEWVLGRSIKHKQLGFCPKCQSVGHFDLEGLGFSPELDNAIYFSTVFDEWRCRMCDLRMIA